MKWKRVWAVIKGERLDAKKSLNSNAGIGLFLLGTIILAVIVSGKIQLTKLMTSTSILRVCFGIFVCYSWLVARKDETRRNELLFFQGVLGMLLILDLAVLLIGQFHSVAYPEPGTEVKIRSVGYAPGLIGGGLYYFGRHLSDFWKSFKIDFNKYIYTLLSISIVLEAVVIYKFIEAISAFLEQF
jgi:hypothetical protein